MSTLPTHRIFTSEIFDKYIRLDTRHSPAELPTWLTDAFIGKLSDPQDRIQTVLSGLHAWTKSGVARKKPLMASTDRPTDINLLDSGAEEAFALFVNYLLRLGDTEAFGLIPAFKHIRPDHRMGLTISVDGLFDTGQQTVFAALGHQVRENLEPFVQDWLRFRLFAATEEFGEEGHGAPPFNVARTGD